MENLISITKIAALLIFFLFYCGIFFWTYRGKNRSKIESYKDIPFRED